jgi:hypothetical protein
VALHTACCGSTFVVTPAAHEPYGAGHVVFWLEQTRGTDAMLHVAPCDVQLAHVAPLEPHLLLTNPALHTPTESQQPGQFCALQTGMHDFWPEQTLPWTLQFWHATPPVPQSVFELPVTHVLPLQQPVGHVAALHAGAWHAWFWQVSPCAPQF